MIYGDYSKYTIRIEYLKLSFTEVLVWRFKLKNMLQDILIRRYCLLKNLREH